MTSRFHPSPRHWRLRCERLAAEGITGYSWRGSGGGVGVLYRRCRGLADFLLLLVEIKIMIPNAKKHDRKDDSEGPLENQPLEWADEDREMEDRKPDLSEIEEDTSGL